MATTEGLVKSSVTAKVLNEDMPISLREDQVKNQTTAKVVKKAATLIATPKRLKASVQSAGKVNSSGGARRRNITNTAS